MPNSPTNPLNHPIVSGSGNPAYTVAASQESTDLVKNSGPGCAPLDGWSELMNNTGLGGLPCRTQLIISANGKSIQAQKCDSGGGSSFQPVIGLYPRVSEFLFGTSNGGEFHVTIQRVDGKPLHPTIGTPASAVAGGTAGLGGTGTALNAKPQANFMIGDSSNPHEDYWTGLNRLAQDRYWLLFSDGETLYLADGPDLMAQDPVAVVDRVADADRIQSLSFTYDNTAFAYAATHKKHDRIQRRSTTAKVASSTQATLELICDIDEVRAGDVIALFNCGPADGRWLVGECERSIFNVYSTITLVPALTPLSEQQVAGAGTITSKTVTSAGSPGALLGTGSSGPSAINMPLPSKDYGTRSNGTASIRIIVLHDTEGPCNASGNPPQDLRVLFQVLDGQGLSAHMGIDCAGNVARYVADDKRAFHVAAYNDVALGIEQVGFASQTSWPEAQLRATAQQVRAWSALYNIPLVFSTTHGVCQHKDLGAAGGGHDDCGPHYPFDHVLKLAGA